MKQRIYIGEASLNNLDIILQEYSAKKVFLVRGKKSYELCGAQSRLNSILKKVGVQIFEFHDFEENPKIEWLSQNLHSREAIRQFAYQTIDTKWNLYYQMNILKQVFLKQAKDE